jgi:hypothetical protein
LEDFPGCRKRQRGQSFAGEKVRPVNVVRSVQLPASNLSPVKNNDMRAARVLQPIQNIQQARHTHLQAGFLQAFALSRLGWILSGIHKPGG